MRPSWPLPSTPTTDPGKIAVFDESTTPLSYPKAKAEINYSADSRH